MFGRNTSFTFGLCSLLCALPSFAQTGFSTFNIQLPSELTYGSVSRTTERLGFVPIETCDQPDPALDANRVQSVPERALCIGYLAELGTAPSTDGPAGAMGMEAPVEMKRTTRSVVFDRGAYYRNKLEYSLDVGWLPVNIPFPFDFMLGSDYNTYPLKYTLVPLIASLRWQMGNPRGPWAFRGNWELSFSGAAVLIPRGPETRYFAYIMGIRRNFVPRRWKIDSYWDGRVGLGNINAKGPLGVPYAQGEDFTFTLNMGSGVRYNFNSRYAISAGVNWMHISNANLSEGHRPGNWGIRNYGINVYGPMIGIDVQLRKPRAQTE